jgi:hypothetical protein
VGRDSYDALSVSREAPALAKVFELTCETRYRLDSARCTAGGDGCSWLNSLAPSETRRLGYDLGVYPSQRALVRGVRLLFVLEAATDAALNFAPASHKAVRPPPSPAVAGEMCVFSSMLALF